MTLIRILPTEAVKSHMPAMVIPAFAWLLSLTIGSPSSPRRGISAG